MVIGWYFIAKEEHLFSALMATRFDDYSLSKITQKLLKRVETTQLADDLIQGIMRSQARIIKTKDGDCKETEVYLFYKNTQQYYDVLDIVKSYFKDVKVVDWRPLGAPKARKRTSSMKTADLILGYLQIHSSKFNDILLSEVIKELELPKYTASRVINSEYFIEELEKSGFKLKNSDGRSKYFILK